MRSISLTLLTAVVIAAAAAGCSSDADGAGNDSKAATPSASATKDPGGAPATAADTKKVCTDVSSEIQDTLKKVTEAEAIGPPAGHHAVSAQYSAGSAAISVHTIGADGQAATAAKGVADAMAEIADKYVDSKSKPDKAPLNTAIDKFKALCAGK